MISRTMDSVARVLNVIAAVWLMAMALVIFMEVTGRGLFGMFMGGDEIVTNSVPAIVFLQVPLAISVGSMLRTTIVFDNLGPIGRRVIDGLSYFLAIVLFVGVAAGGWGDMVKGWEIGEFQGIGALEVPVYPIRTIIIGSAILIVLIYGNLLLRALLGTGTDSGSGAPGAKSGVME